MQDKRIVFEEWWKEDKTDFLEAFADGEWIEKRIAELAWQAAVEACIEVINEAEYAMVGGNCIKEDINWETADGWFRWIDKSIRSM